MSTKSPEGPAQENWMLVRDFAAAFLTCRDNPPMVCAFRHVAFMLPALQSGRTRREVFSHALKKSQCTPICSFGLLLQSMPLGRRRVSQAGRPSKFPYSFAFGGQVTSDMRTPLACRSFILQRCDDTRSIFQVMNAHGSICNS